MTENDTNTNESLDGTSTPSTASQAQAATPTAAQPVQPTEAAPAEQPAGTYAAPGSYAPQYAPAQPAQPANAGSWGWIALGIFIPLVGLILFLVWRKDKPLSAKASGIGAIIGVVLNVIVSIVVAMAMVPAMLAASDSYTYQSTTTTTQSATDNSTGTSSTYADEGLIEAAGSAILPELGAGEYIFQPEECYWVNEDPEEGDWLYGYWTTSVDDPTVIEFWGARDMDDEEGELVGSIPADSLKSNFVKAGYTGDVELELA